MKVLVAFVLFILVVIAAASSTIVLGHKLVDDKSSSSSSHQKFNNRHHNHHQQQKILRAPKINAKYNLTTQDKNKVEAGNVLGFDLYLPYPSTTFACLQQNNYQFMITRAWHSYGAPDFSASINLNNALVAGINYRDIYFFPCISNSTASAAAQLRQAVQVTPTETWGTLWFDIELNPSDNCAWSTTDYAANCAFLTALIQEAQALSLQVGLYSSHWEWLQLFGSADYCTVAYDNGLPLWFANYDRQQTFADFQSFGGYTLNGGGSNGKGRVAIKQFYDQVSVCNVTADANFYPS